MRAGRIYGTKINAPRAQRGVVLLITLIILVAMTLAGIGMMRSVDTGSIIAGNMAFRQAAANAGEAGTQVAFNYLINVANSNNPVDPRADKTILNFNNNQPCPLNATPSLCSGGNINLPGYQSTPILACEVRQTCAPGANAALWWSVDANWNNAPSVPVFDPGGQKVATVDYLIHRMCEQPGIGPNGAGQLCQTYTVLTTGGSKTQLLPTKSTSVFYRITTRSHGARDTVAYSQTLVLIAD